MTRLWWLVSLLLMAGFWWLSSQGGAAGLAFPHPLDWLAHAVQYLLLGYALGRATGRPALAWVIAAWFGAVDEVHQAFVPQRAPDITDWLADLLAAYLGSRLAAGRERRRAEGQRRVRAEGERAA